MLKVYSRTPFFECLGLIVNLSQSQTMKLRSNHWSMILCFLERRCLSFMITLESCLSWRVYGQCLSDQMSLLCHACLAQTVFIVVFTQQNLIWIFESEFSSLSSFKSLLVHLQFPQLALASH